MKKKFFASLLVVNFLFNYFCDEIENNFEIETKNFFCVKVANAANINWNSAPRFNNMKSLVDYFVRNKKILKTQHPIVCTNGFIPNGANLPDLATLWYLNWTNYGSDGQNSYFLFEVAHTPGERVAYAYLHNDTSFLNNEELKLYREAVKIVNDAKQFVQGRSAQGLYYELYFHELITSRTKYYTENPQPPYARFQTALGVLLDGRANCQGYADAFYMLCNMVGIDVGKVSGYANNVPHVWNTVTYGDGKYYFVDVTYDDANFTFNDTGEQNGYIYFNATRDIMTTHNWSSAYTPDIQQHPDGRYFYYTKEFDNSNGRYFGAYSRNAEDALSYAAERIADGWKWSWICANSYDARYANPQNAVNHLLYDLLPRYNWYGHVNVNVATRGKYIFFTIEAKRN